MNRIAPVFGLTLCLWVGSLPLNAQAQTNDNRQDLPKNDLQTNREAYQREDLELNIAYRKLMAQLQEQGRERLKNAQLAWLKFRDLQCEFERGSREGESLQSIQHKSCLAAATRQRTNELSAWLKDPNRH